MCGIAGRLNFVSGAPVDPATVAGMAHLLAHRGPDDEGMRVRGAVAFAHRRLSVIDLSKAASQPMTTEDGEMWITYNGEIYNFLEVRRELETYGVRFRSRSDTEVILAAYGRWGVSCVERLTGMFAFGIWDGPRRVLMLARDRLGKKPLYYRLDNDGIAFASESKAFLAEPSFQREVEIDAISHYLSYQYVPAEMSAFRGVCKLPPAHCLVVQDGRISISRYWRLRYGPKLRISEQEASEELIARLREAVRLRLVSDVPVGAFLSGGLDSSLVVALMAQERADRVRTFSIGFDEEGWNELPYARLAARRYDTDHHEFVVRPNAIEVLPKLVWHYGEPFADSSAVPSYYLAELTRQHVTVALTGDGGDENFAGYSRYVANLAAPWYQKIPKLLRRPLEACVMRVPSIDARSAVGRAKRFVEALHYSREERYARWLMHFQPDLKRELCTSEFLDHTRRDSLDFIVDQFAASETSDFTDATLDVDVNHYLPDDLLVKVDIATMAHGLEARSPFLDHQFMEFAASLPSSLKLRGRTTKYILKKAARRMLPDALIDRPKMGFGVPIDRWFRRELREFAADVLLSRQCQQRGYFHASVVRRLLDEHVKGVRSWHSQLWNLIMLELWHCTFIDSRPANRGAIPCQDASL